MPLSGYIGAEHLALDLLPCIFAHRYFLRSSSIFSSQFAANCYICIGVTLQQKVVVTDFHFHRLTQDSGREGGLLCKGVAVAEEFEPIGSSSLEI